MLQIAHAWSFQIPDQEDLAETIKAWGWTIADARAGGGAIRLRSGQTFDVAEDVDVRVVFVPPAEGFEAPAFDEAKNVFQSVNAIATPVSEAASIAREARSLLVAAGVALDL
ncbi:MAG: hypothetical protein WKF86_07885 [Acidimicrobiales bacterium]